MTVIRDVHEDHGATFGTVGGREVVVDYGRPERAHLAVRRVVGLTEPAYGVVVVEGDDRVRAVDRTLTAAPDEETEGVYAVHRRPDGTVATDAVVYHAGERLLCFTPPDRASDLRDALSGSGESVAVREATDDFAVFGIHGPKATEKVASVLHGATVPDQRFTFVRGRLDEAGVTVVRTDAPTGEEGYEVICSVGGAHEAVDVLLNQGLNAAPFGYRTWETLTLEAGTPLFDPDLRACGPDQSLVGVAPDGPASAGATVVADGDPVGRITRAVESPVLDAPIAFAAVDPHADGADLAVRDDGDDLPVQRRTLPFVDGSDRSGRIPGE